MLLEDRYAQDLLGSYPVTALRRVDPLSATNAKVLVNQRHHLRQSVEQGSDSDQFLRMGVGDWRWRERQPFE